MDYSIVAWLRSVAWIADHMQRLVVHGNNPFVPPLAIRSSARLHFVRPPLWEDGRTPFLSKHVQSFWRPGRGGYDRP